MARTITSREEWNSIPVGSHVLVQYAGKEGTGPGEVVFTRHAETLRWDYGSYRMSGGSNWDGAWDHVESAALLDYAEAKARWDAHQSSNLERALADYHEAAKRKDEEVTLSAKPLGGIRLAFLRIFG